MNPLDKLRQELEKQVRTAMQCNDTEHLISSGYNTCYNCQVEKVMALIQSERLKAKREALEELRHSIDEAYSPEIFGHLDDLQGCLDCTAAAGARLTLNFIDSRLAELDSLEEEK